MARCRYEMPGHLLTGVCLKVENPSVHLWTDASLAGWGSHPPWWRVGGLWVSTVGHLHVIVLGDVGVSLASAFSGVGDCRYPPGVQHDGLGFCSVSRGDSFLPMLRRGQGSVSLGVGEPGDPDASICAEPPQCLGGCSIEVVHGGAVRVGSQPLGLQSSLDLFASSVDIRVPLFFLSIAEGVRLGDGRLPSELGWHGPVAPWCVRLQWFQMSGDSVSLSREVCRSVMTSCLGATPAARLEALRYLCQVLGLERDVAYSVAVMQGASIFDLYQMHWDVWSRWCRARDLSPFAMSVPLLLFFRHLFEEFG